VSVGVSADRAGTAIGIAAIPVFADRSRRPPVGRLTASGGLSRGPEEFEQLVERHLIGRPVGSRGLHMHSLMWKRRNVSTRKGGRQNRGDLGKSLAG